MSKKINIRMTEMTEDGFVTKHPETNMDMVKGLGVELDNKANKEDIPTTLSDLKVSDNWDANAGTTVQGLHTYKADKSYVEEELDKKADDDKVDEINKLLRDDGSKHIRVLNASKEPAPEDGRIYYNTSEKLFYMARDGQWYRLFVVGDDKLEQNPPKTAPSLQAKTDTTVTLKIEEGKEYRYQGGAWQEDGYFSGLHRNTTYRFESRFKGDEVYKASPASPGLSVTTNKGEQSAPRNPRYEVLSIDSEGVRVKVTANDSNTEVALMLGTGRPSESSWRESGTIYRCNFATKYTVYARKKETNTHNPSPASSGLTFTTESPDDTSGSPGNNMLKKGTKQEGYFGLVSSSQLISGSSLASRVGVTEGNLQNSTTPWHKFAYKGKILFIAQKTIRNSISWNHLNDKDVVYGNKTIEINGVKYKVRLLKGTLTDPADNSAKDEGCKGSEWNRLLAPLHIERKDNSWSFSWYMEDDLKDWETYLSDEELTTGDGDGGSSWCQETDGEYESQRIVRGGKTYGVSLRRANWSHESLGWLGWRPVLEVVE